MQNNSLQISPCRSEDLPEVLRVERACYPHPWTPAQFQQELDNPCAHLELCWQQEELVGYLCYWLIAGEMQILNVATSPSWRRQGVAERLLKHCLHSCQRQRLMRAWLEVRASNKAAISLYRQQGFFISGSRPGYYRDGEDALLMVFDLES